MVGPAARAVEPTIRPRATANRSFGIPGSSHAAPFRGKAFRDSPAGSLAGARADAQARREGRVHAHAERRRTVRVLGAELATCEPAVVDAHLGRAAREARAHAAARFAARERAVLAADRAPVAVGVRAAAPADAVPGRSGTVVETAIGGGAVCPARALDPRAARARRRRTRRRVGHEGGRGSVVGALAVVRGDAGHAADQVRERRDRAAPGAPPGPGAAR